MPERARRGLAGVGIVTGLVLCATAVPIVQFYRSYWSQLTTLPQIVARHEARHGGRWTSFGAVSPWVKKALIATEDRTFYSNLGISFEGIGRALLVDLHTHRFAQGGSTITQQLARDTLLTPVKKFRRKVSEALLATMMTVLYTKHQVLTLYLNDIYLGAGAWGVAAASQRYFGLAPSQLNLPQGALIAGLPNAPSAENPLAHPRLAKKRQGEVLTSMVADHMITPVQARHAYRTPLKLLHRPH